VLGGASCVFDDAKLALGLFTPDAVFAINDMIARWPERVDYVVTLHPEKLAGWLRQRKKAGYGMHFQTWAHARKPNSLPVDRVTPDWGGSSGLFACKVALEEGFDKIVLAGVPMTVRDKHFVRNKEWSAATGYLAAWKKRHPLLKDNVRSMSGFTRDLLGEPCAVWWDAAAS
jgi:hypothetical protein